MLYAILFVVFLTVSTTRGTLSPDGTKCGQKKCSTTEYCSPFDSQCRPCANICDSTSRNHQADLCVKDCQEYLHDQRYVLREEISGGDNLKVEVQRLRILVAVTLTLTCLSLLIVIVLVARKFLALKKLRKILQSGWLRKQWVKKATNNNRVQDDAEAARGQVKQNGLKLAMPTISATVPTEAGTASNPGTATPDTTSTPLSRRHPSEDTTLDYAYDNPAMTPSPEVAQTREKRESSF